jgi:hypothetical protein
VHRLTDVILYIPKRAQTCCLEQMGASWRTVRVERWTVSGLRKRSLSIVVGARARGNVCHPGARRESRYNGRLGGRDDNVRGGKLLIDIGRELGERNSHFDKDST